VRRTMHMGFGDVSHSSVTDLRAAAASIAVVQQPRMPHLGVVQGNACVCGG
jgi:hypothetical protein